jgi:hypothetical protein
MFSQEIKPGKPNELDNIYSPDKTSSKAILNPATTYVLDKKNFLKLNFGLFARSTFALHYERKLNDVTKKTKSKQLLQKMIFTS